MTSPDQGPAAPEDRFVRQASLVPRERLLALPLIDVIGVGATGRKIVMELASLGAHRLRLVDDDKVELTNVTTQGYRHADIGNRKVEAAMKAALELSPEMQIEIFADRWTTKMPVAPVVFCCVDSIDTRAAIFNHVMLRQNGQDKDGTRQCQFFVDGRIQGETLRVLAVDTDTGCEPYEASLFTGAEAQTGSCTARGTGYTASIAAGMMIHQFVRWLRGWALDTDMSYSLPASELVVSEPAKV